MPPRHPSGDYDPQASVGPALILAMRSEISMALEPVNRRLDKIDERLAEGDTQLALLGERWEAHTNPADATTRKMSKGSRTAELIRAAVITAVATTLSSLLVVWVLHGLAQTAAKGTP